jgi:hypothetical protein
MQPLHSVHKVQAPAEHIPKANTALLWHGPWPFQTLGHARLEASADQPAAQANQIMHNISMWHAGHL